MFTGELPPDAVTDHRALRNERIEALLRDFDVTFNDRDFARLTKAQSPRIVDAAQPVLTPHFCKRRLFPYTNIRVCALVRASCYVEATMRRFLFTLSLVISAGGCRTERPPHAMADVATPVATAEPRPAAPKLVAIAEQTDFGGPQVAGQNALRGLVYFLPEGTARLASTAGLRPVAELYATQLDIAARAWTDGFPGVPGGRVEWFQIIYEGSLVTSQPGEHRFELYSDDGSKLFLDGALVVDNDGLHPPHSAQGAAVLQPGGHAIRVEYFQGPRAHIALQLYATPPGGGRRILDVASGL